MKTVHVQASTEYDVLVGAGLLQTLGERASALCKTRKTAIISDSNVWPLYGQAAEESLIHAGFQAVSFVIPAGESSKNGEVYLELLNFLAENQLTRTDLLIALGGGVVGDLTGFAAATYLRGVPYIQVPTTLLAAVDSSVGGKTAIDLPAGKNLAGAFYQPSLVLCDVDTLNSLPDNVFRDGCAEVIKYGVLYDPELFTHLKEYGLDFHREDVIAQCVTLKQNVVAEDEFDTGARMKLNLGHTIGHGIEAQSEFRISHGEAVAIGMSIVSRSAVKLGICSQDTCDTILSVLNSFGLPTSTEFTADSLFLSALSDKKRSGSTVSLIIPQAIGDCIICATPVNELKSFIKAGL